MYSVNYNVSYKTMAGYSGGVECVCEYLCLSAVICTATFVRHTYKRSVSHTVPAITIFRVYCMCTAYYVCFEKWGESQK